MKVLLAKDKSKSIDYYFTVKEYGSSIKGVVFLFCGWRIKPVFYRLIIRNLNKAGLNVILYIPNKELIAVGTQYTEVVTASRFAVEDVGTRIVEEPDGQDKIFISYGTSFGSVFAMEVAKSYPNIKKVVLVSPFGRPEKHLMKWANQRMFRKIVDSQDTNLTESGKVLNQIDSMRNLHLLKGKELLVYVSTKDKVAHTPLVEELVEQLRQVDITAEIIRVPTGHIMGGLRHAFLDKYYVDFLNKDLLKP